MIIKEISPQRKSMQKSYIKRLLGGIVALSAFVNNAYALPSYARQTGLSCTACHTVFPELTQMGRDFKMRGYTMTGGESKIPLPMSAMLMVDMTKSSDNTDIAQMVQSSSHKSVFFTAERLQINLVHLYN